MRENLDSMSRSISTAPLDYSRNRLQIRMYLKAERQKIGVAPYENSCSVNADFIPERGIFLVTFPKSFSLIFIIHIFQHIQHQFNLYLSDFQHLLIYNLFKFQDVSLILSPSNFSSALFHFQCFSLPLCVMTDT